MPAILYIDGATNTITSVAPSLEGRAVIEVSVGTLQNTAGVEAVVILVTIG
jgi:hypothetical protein